MTPEQTLLVERVAALLADEPLVREVSMFGARAVMVNEKMVVAALKTGGLLVRVDADRHEELLTRAGASQARMGPGRDMGPGWIEVEAEALAAAEQLAEWVGIAMERNRTVADARRTGLGA